MIFLHLGDFHFMKELFTMLDTLVKGSGFEDVICQAGVCSAGSPNRILSGSDYNHCWTVHSVMGERIERFFMELFMNNGNVLSNEVRMCCEEIPMSSKFLADGDAVTPFTDKYEEFKADIRNGKYGKTAKFWVAYYMDVLSKIIQIHHVIQTNDFGLRLDALKKALPFCFALNKQKLYTLWYNLCSQLG